MSLKITEQNFDSVVKNQDKLAIVDFWAEWCGPCKVVGPVIDRLAEEYGDKAVIGKIDIDANPMLAASNGVRNIPSIIFFKNGKEIDRHIGALPYSVLEQKLKEFLAK